ncbi:hypothetical protein PWT90_05788 [Aphanocladium album]|nr:hypothetical protein PWT90_05788 [Aphanocladium album]
MNRSRSVSRRPSFRHRYDSSISPTRSASRSSSIGSAYKADRSRSQSRAPSAYHRREHASSSSSSSGGGGTANTGLTTSTVLAGIGIAALVARKFWPKTSSSSSTSAEREDRAGHAHRAAQDWRGPRGRDVERRSHRQASTLSSYAHNYGKAGVKGEDAGYYLREPRRRSMDRRSWGADDARCNMQSTTGYGRRYS